MASYTIAIRCQYPAGTNLANVNATCRNENTNESKTLTTNSAGEVIWNLGDTVDFPSGFLRGDKITVFSLYQGFQQSFAFSVPSIGQSISVTDNSNINVGSATGGNLTGNLVLVAVPIAPSLKIFTVQEFLDYFNLKEYSADQENGIKAQRIVLIGQSVELMIENETRTKFDNNAGAYYSVTDEYHDARFERHNNYYLKSVPVIRMIKFEVNQRAEGSDTVFKNLVHDQIDSMDATTGWTAGSGGSITLNSTPSQVNEGSASLNLVKSGTSAAAVTYSKSFSTNYEFFERKINVDFFIETASNLAVTDGVALRFGLDSSNYYEQTYDRSDFANASWKTIGFARKDTGVTVTGSPGTSALTYFAIVVTMTTAATTVAAPDMRLDDLRLNEKNRVNVDLDTGRVRITDAIDYADEGKRHTRTTYTYGRASVPADIRTLAILWCGQMLLGHTFLKTRFTDKEGPTEAQLTWFEDFKRMVIMKYRNPLILPT